MSKEQRVLKFVLNCAGHPTDLFARFQPNGRRVLNRTEWRGKEPRSCGVTRLTIPSAGNYERSLLHIEVSDRPKGCITFAGNTKYDGWTAMVPVDVGLDSDCESPTYQACEVYDDVEFNDIDFGEFVGEFPVEGIKRLRFEDVFNEISASPQIEGSISSSFIASRRHRPLVQILLSDEPSGTTVDGFGTRIVRISRFTPQLQQVIQNELTELVDGFVEGRFSIKTFTNGSLVFADLTNVVFNATAESASHPECIIDHVSETFFEDLAIRLTATYEVDVSIVEGEQVGLLFQHSDS